MERKQRSPNPYHKPKSRGRPPLSDPRRRRRNENARVAETPADLDLIRRPSSPGLSEPLRAAVLAALLLGQPSHQIAAQFGLPAATVAAWEANFSITNPIQRRDQISEMLVVFVQQEIASLMSISIATSDEDWILEQSASDLAVLIGVKHDRLMRILEAFGRANSQVLEAESYDS